MLQHGRNTLQTHTGIHGRFRQRFHGAVSLTVELHEDDVPNLNVAIAIFFCASRRPTPDMVAVVVENFGAWTTRTGITHLPEVVGSISRTFVITDADDTFARNTDFFFPDFIGFIVSFIDGDPQTLFWQGKPVFTGQQFPCILNSIVFEVIAEAEVAQHFEESVVTCSVTDVFQVIVLTTRTYTTLRGGCAGIITLVEAKENILELVHPGVGKQQSRVIVRYQGAAGNYLVSFTMEKIEKRLTDLSGALAHNYPEEIKLTKCHYQHRQANCASGNRKVGIR